MSSSPSTPDDPGLFDDLPLHTEKPPSRVAPTPVRREPPPAQSEPAEEKSVPEVQPPEEPRLLFQEGPDDGAASPEPDRQPKVAETEPTKDVADLARSRLVAGLLDLGVIVAVAISAIVCVAWMGVDLTPLPWAPIALFLTAFSFLYYVFPLAFWGRTPGMSYLGLRARNLDGQPLSFGQTALRWLAGLLTVASFGLPLLLALKGTHLSDLLSQSQVEVSGR